MKNAILVLSLFLSTSFAFAIEEINFVDVASVYGGYGLRNSYYRPKYGHRHNFGLNRIRRGYLTGFSPPINYSYNNYPNSYYYNQNPFSLNNSINLTTRIKRFFNPNYNNFDPFYQTNNNSIHSKKYIQLFDSNGNNGGGYYQNGYGFDNDIKSNAGATVTIID